MTRELFLTELDRTFGEVQPGGPPRQRNILLYVSAHGAIDEKNEPCLLFADADPLDSLEFLENRIAPLLDRARFQELGGFHEGALFAEDYMLSKQVALAVSEAVEALLPGLLLDHSRWNKQVMLYPQLGLWLLTVVAIGVASIIGAVVYTGGPWPAGWSRQALRWRPRPRGPALRLRPPGRTRPARRASARATRRCR